MFRTLAARFARVWGRIVFGGALFCLGLSSVQAKPSVAILYGSAWSPGDTARDGAAEFEILLCAARVRSNSSLPGLVGVGNRHGSFSPAAESALERVALMGIPVVRLALGEPLRTHEGDLFIEAGSLSVTDAQRLLGSCLRRYGALPAAADPLRPTKKERAAIESKLALYQLQFDAQSAATIAAR